jgi:hypothetical protein
MNEKLDKSKNKDRRLEEKEKLEAEAERSIAVAKMKQAHKLIEDTEKSRKRSAVMSICKRIENQIKDIQSLIDAMDKTQAVLPPTRGTVFGEAIEGIFRTYDSVRYDIQKTLEIKDDDFAKLFPKKEPNTQSIPLAKTSLVLLWDQLRDMRIYCERLLQ